MPRAYRLTVADLKSFRPSRRLHGTYFSLAIASAKKTGVACVVSKKIAARAVARNLVKRRTRAVIAPALSSLPPAHYVFYAKKDSPKVTFLEVENDLKKLLARVRA